MVTRALRLSPKAVRVRIVPYVSGAMLPRDDPGCPPGPHLCWLHDRRTQQLLEGAATSGYRCSLCSTTGRTTGPMTGVVRLDAGERCAPSARVHPGTQRGCEHQHRLAIWHMHRLLLRTQARLVPESFKYSCACLRNQSSAPLKERLITHRNPERLISCDFKIPRQPTHV